MSWGYRSVILGIVIFVRSWVFVLKDMLIKIVFQLAGARKILPHSVLAVRVSLIVPTLQATLWQHAY